MSAKAGRVPRGGVGDSPATSVSSAGPSPSRVGRDFDDNSCPTTVLILVLHAGSVLGNFEAKLKIFNILKSLFL